MLRLPRRILMLCLWKKRASVLDELGFIHEYGLNVPMNREQALQYYKLACELGGNYSCYNVKYAYQYGDGSGQR